MEDGLSKVRGGETCRVGEVVVPVKLLQQLVESLGVAGGMRGVVGIKRV